MPETPFETALEAPSTEAESELHGLALVAAAGGLPATLRFDDRSLFVVDAAMDLPAYLRAEGRTLVLIGGDEYKELLSSRSELLRQGLRPAARKAAPAARVGLSTIERDAEVAAFLRERFRGGVTLDQLHNACVEAFGAERTPSVSRIGQFRRKVWGR